MAAEQAKPDYKAELADVLSSALGPSYENAGIEFKPFFGAQTCYADGEIFASRGKFGLALKLPPAVRGELIDNEGAEPLRYFPKGHVKKDYVVIPRRIVMDAAAIKSLVAQSIAFVRTDKP